MANAIDKAYFDECLANVQAVMNGQAAALQEHLRTLSLSGRPSKEQIEEAYKEKVEESTKKIKDQQDEAEKKAHQELEKKLNKSREALLTENRIQAQEKELEKYRTELGLGEKPSKADIETAFKTKTEQLLKDKPDAKERKPLAEALTKAKEALIKEDELEENRKALGVTRRSSSGEIADAAKNLAAKYPHLKDKLANAKKVLDTDKENQAKLVMDAKPEEAEGHKKEFQISWENVGRGGSWLAGKGVGPAVVKSVGLLFKQTWDGARGGSANAALLVDTKVKNRVARGVLIVPAALLGGIVGAAAGVPITLGAAVNEFAVKPGKKVAQKLKLGLQRRKAEREEGKKAAEAAKREEVKKEAAILEAEIQALQKQAQDLQNSPLKGEEENKQAKELAAKIAVRQDALLKLTRKGKTPVIPVTQVTPVTQKPGRRSSLGDQFNGVANRFEAITQTGTVALAPAPAQQPNAKPQTPAVPFDAGAPKPIVVAHRVFHQRAASLNELAKPAKVPVSPPEEAVVTPQQRRKSLPNI